MILQTLSDSTVLWNLKCEWHGGNAVTFSEIDSSTVLATNLLAALANVVSGRSMYTEQSEACIGSSEPPRLPVFFNRLGLSERELRTKSDDSSQRGRYAT